MLSPELALVDPELAAAARAALPDPGDCLVLPQRATRALRHPSSDPEGQPIRVRRPRAGSLVLTGGLWICLAAIGASSFLAFVTPSESSRPSFAPTPVGQTDAAAAEPRKAMTTPSVSRRFSDNETGRTKPTPVLQTARSAEERRGRTFTIRWPATRNADFYDVVLVRGTRRIDAWPSGNSFTYEVPVGVLRAATNRAVRYRWFVYPGYRAGSAMRFGREIARGSVTVRLR